MIQRSLQGRAILHQLEGTSHLQDMWDSNHIQGMSDLEDSQVTNHGYQPQGYAPPGGYGQPIAAQPIGGVAPGPPGK
jgi:hypothetical protein